MRLGITNYLDDSTVTATNENSSFPAENLYHKFLEKRFQALGSQSTVTVLFPEDRTISMFGMGFFNVTDSDTVYSLSKTATDTKQLDKTATDTKVIQPASYYQIKNAAGTVLQTGEIDLTNDTMITYITPITGRSMEFTFAAPSGSALYVGGLCISDYLDIEYTNINPDMNIGTRYSREVTDGGQSITKYRRELENWVVRCSILTNAKRKEIVAAVRATRKPIFVDLYPLNHDEYFPLYADVTAWGDFQRDSNSGTYNTSISVEERR